MGGKLTCATRVRFGFMVTRHQQPILKGSPNHIIQRTRASQIGQAQLGGPRLARTADLDQSASMRSCSFLAVLIVGLLLAGCALHRRPSRGIASVNSCINNLRQIDAAEQQWALEHHKTTNDIPTWDDVLPYLGQARPSVPVCPQGGTYTLARLDEFPKCSLGGPSHSLQ